MAGERENREIADSIRIDASTVSPSETSAATDYLYSVAGKFEIVFDEYLGPGAKERARLAMDSLVITDDVRLLSLEYRSQELHPKAVGIYTSYPTPLLAVTARENILDWDGLTNIERETVDRIGLGNNLDEGSIREKIVQREYYLSLTHELAHSYINPDLPLYVREIGAYFVSDVLFKMGTTEEVESPTSEYSHLINKFREKYGDNVYKVLFGKSVNFITRHRMLKDFKSVIQDPDNFGVEAERVEVFSA